MSQPPVGLHNNWVSLKPIETGTIKNMKKVARCPRSGRDIATDSINATFLIGMCKVNRHANVTSAYTQNYTVFTKRNDFVTSRPCAGIMVV